MKVPKPLTMTLSGAVIPAALSYTAVRQRCMQHNRRADLPSEERTLAISVIACGLSTRLHLIGETIWENAIQFSSIWRSNPLRSLSHAVIPSGSSASSHRIQNSTKPIEAAFNILPRKAWATSRIYTESCTLVYYFRSFAALLSFGPCTL